VGLVVFAVIIGYHARAIAASDVPHLRMVQAVASGLPMLLLLFAATYVLIARDDPGSFSQMLNRTGALYFTLTVSPRSASVTSPRTATWRASSR